MPTAVTVPIVPLTDPLVIARAKSVLFKPVIFSLKIVLKVTDVIPVMASVVGDWRLMLFTMGAVLSNTTWLPLVVVVTGVPAVPVVLVKLIVNGTTPAASVVCIVRDAL